MSKIFVCASYQTVRHMLFLFFLTRANCARCRPQEFYLSFDSLARISKLAVACVYIVITMYIYVAGLVLLQFRRVDSTNM